MNISTSIANNWISCLFSRLVSDASVPGYLNLSNQYYLLGAIGAYSDSAPHHHSIKSFSYSLVDFNKLMSSSNAGHLLDSKLAIFTYLILFLSIFYNINSV